MIQFQENNPTEAGWKDGRTLFRGTLQATTWGLTSTTAVKFKDIEYDYREITASQSACKKIAEFVNSIFRYSRF